MDIVRTKNQRLKFESRSAPNLFLQFTYPPSEPQFTVCKMRSWDSKGLFIRGFLVF